MGKRMRGKDRHRDKKNRYIDKKYKERGVKERLERL